jgi:hypothetical protein
MEASIHYTNVERKGIYVVKKENRIYKGTYFHKDDAHLFFHILFLDVSPWS